MGSRLCPLHDAARSFAPYLESLNRVTELDLQRKAARAAGVPLEVFVMLIVYMITSAFVLDYVLRGRLGASRPVFSWRCSPSRWC
jgi:hypothetical protein